LPCEANPPWSTKLGCSPSQKTLSFETGIALITKLESYQPGKRPLLTMGTLRRYAEAVGCRLIVRLEPLQQVEQPENS